MNDPKDTLEQKLYKAHNLIDDVLDCLDFSSEEYYKLLKAQDKIYAAWNIIPRNLRKYKPNSEKGKK